MTWGFFFLLLSPLVDATWEARRGLIGISGLDKLCQPHFRLSFPELKISVRQLAAGAGEQPKP